MAARVTQAVVEVLSRPTPAARVTDASVELLSHPTPATRVTHSVLEVLSLGVPDLALTSGTRLSTLQLYVPSVALPQPTIPSTRQLFAPTITVSATSIALPTISPTRQLFPPTVTGPYTLLLVSRSSTLQLFPPTVLAVSPTNIALATISSTRQLFWLSVSAPAPVVCIEGGFPIDEVPGWNDGAGGPIEPPFDLCALPTGSIMVFGYGDSGTARYLSPDGTISYAQPLSSPTPGSGVSACCRLSTGDVALVGGGGSDITDPDFPTTGAGVYAGCALTKRSEIAVLSTQDGRSITADALGHYYTLHSWAGTFNTYVTFSRLTADSVVVGTWSIVLPPQYWDYTLFPGAATMAVTDDGQTVFCWLSRSDGLGPGGLGNTRLTLHAFSLAGAGAWLRQVTTDYNFFGAGYNSLLVVPGTTDVLVAFARLNGDYYEEYVTALRRYTATGTLVWEASAPAGAGVLTWEGLAAGKPGDTHFLAWAYDESVTTYSEARYCWFSYATGTPDNTRNFTPEDGDFQFDSQFVILAGQPPARGILPRRRST